MSSQEITPVITKSNLRRECIAYLGKNNIRKISYTDLSKYITETKKIELNNENFYYDHKLINVFVDVSYFDLPSFNKIHQTYKGDEKIKKEKQIDFLKLEFAINETIFDEYKVIEKELIQEERLEKAEKDSKRSLDISWWSFWIAIAAFVISGAQLWVDYYDIHHGKDFEHETRIIELDSMQVKLDSIQVEQNKKIIELLGTKPHKDTVIIAYQPLIKK